MIFKIQQSLSPGDKSILSYDKNRKYFIETTNQEGVAAALYWLQGRPKAYFKVELFDDSYKIIKEVKKQDW